jgi:phosphomevalonate kinase
VLDTRYAGLVVALDAYFEVRIAHLASTPTLLMHIQSPQFLNGNWAYEWEPSNGRLAEKIGVNPFVRIALELSIAYMQYKDAEKFRSRAGCSIEVRILADNDFYSQQAYLKNHQLKPNIDSLRKIPKQNHSGSTISEVHKTGLGSSAAMVTALVGAVLTHFGYVGQAALSSEDIIIIEKIAHCRAILSRCPLFSAR